MSQNFPFPFPSNGAVPPQPTYQQPAQNAAMPASNSATPQSASQSQQVAFLQNAQLPGVDMSSILQSIPPEHLAALGQLFQAGLFPLPSTSNGAAQPAAPVGESSVTQQNGGNGALQPQEEDSMSLDKEEGEWEDGEDAPQQTSHFLHPPPTGPRKRSGSNHASNDHYGMDKRARRQQSSPRQPAGYDRRRPEPRSSIPNSPPPSSPILQRRAKHEAAKTFVLAAYRAGFTFDDLAKETGDAKMLRVLFKELELKAPSKSSHHFSAVEKNAHLGNLSVNGVANAAIPAATKSSPSASSPNALASNQTSKRAPASKASAPAPLDRSAYLAKLQAAKNKKNEGSPSTTGPSNAGQALSAAPAAAPAPPTVLSSAPSAPGAPTVPQPRKANVQTDLIRKRLEALKAEQARKSEAERLANAAALTGTNNTPTIPSAQSSMPQSPANATSAVPAQAAPALSSRQPTAAPNQAFSAVSQFPGLPGLFMTGSPAPAAALGYPNQPSTSDPAVKTDKPLQSTHGVPAGDDERTQSARRSSPDGTRGEPLHKTAPSGESSVPQSGQATPKHFFNQNKYDSNDDSVIIHVSDEEDESELDDADEEVDPDAAPFNTSTPKPNKPGPLHNMPAPVIATASAPGTPGATTPGGSAYHRKLQEIQEMNKRIAEMQKQSKKAKPKTSSTTDLAPTLAAAPAVSPSVSAVVPGGLPGLSTAGNAPTTNDTPSTVSIEQQRRNLESRIAQLQAETGTMPPAEPTASPKVAQPSTSLQAGGVDEPEETMSSDSNDNDDDDDAMDLSSGDESDEIDSNGDVPAEGRKGLEYDISEGKETQPSDAAHSTTGSMDTSDDSEESTSSSEDDSEDSEEDYEPELAASDVAMPDIPKTEVAPAPSQLSGLPGLGSQTVSSTSTLQAENGPEDADLAPELQPQTREQDNSTPEQHASSRSHYTPYESPLRMFKDYRFHPKYTSDVQGGYKSLTYSNKIDPSEFICPAELSDGICRDSQCTSQHFRDIAVNDGELLKDLGTRNVPWKTQEDEKRWKAGLTAVVKQLRASNKGSDVNAIADAIAQFRREFVGKPDQILHLNGP